MVVGAGVVVVVGLGVVVVGAGVVVVGASVVMTRVVLGGGLHLQYKSSHLFGAVQVHTQHIVSLVELQRKF